MTPRPITVSIWLLTTLSVCSGCPAMPAGDRPSRADITAVSAQEHRAALVTAGAENCAASGCHGMPYDGTKRNWQTAYGVWLQEDPHRRSMDVLYTDRSVEMYRNLHPEAKLATEPPQDEPYREFLAVRCVGCHGDVAIGIPARTAAERPAPWAGVGCESCHGPAGGWLHAHYLTSWPRPGDPRRGSLSGIGFFDTANLQSRAGVCAGCHVGPQIAADRVYEVDHELIAAGHPLLAFELDAYLENYPPHWNRALDQQRHVRATGGSLHVDAWRFGQEQLARQQRRQIELRQPRSEPSTPGQWPDFASFRCGDCHHGLSAQRLAGAATGTGLPRPAEALRLRGGKLNFVPVLELGERGWDLSEAGQSWASCPTTELPAHASLMAALVESHSDAGLDFDRAVQVYLAAQALLRDLPPDHREHQELAAAAAQLQEALEDPGHFAAGARRVTQYDGAAAFDPLRISPALARLQEALARIGSSPHGSASP